MFVDIHGYCSTCDDLNPFCLVCPQVDYNENLCLVCDKYGYVSVTNPSVNWFQNKCILNDCTNYDPITGECHKCDWFNYQ